MKSFYAFFGVNMIISSVASLGIYGLMRIVKHKGSKDFRYMLVWTVFIAGFLFDSSNDEKIY